jgi:hypothetical protein
LNRLAGQTGCEAITGVSKQIGTIRSEVLGGGEERLDHAVVFAGRALHRVEVGGRLLEQTLRAHPTQGGAHDNESGPASRPVPGSGDTNTHRIVADIGWGRTEVVFHIEMTEPGIPLDDLAVLRKRS